MADDVSEQPKLSAALKCDEGPKWGVAIADHIEGP